MVEKAVLDVLEGDYKGSIKVMFNPTEYSLPLEVAWKGDPGSMPQYEKSNFGGFGVTLLFDTYEKESDVREGENGTKKLANLALPSVSGKKKKRPPMCLFIWGKFRYKGVIEKIDQKFTMFLNDGTPVRASVTISMKPILSVKDMMKLNGSKDSRKFYQVKPGDRLDIIAEDQLKNPALWQVIAKANAIKDPVSFPAPSDYGRTLIIPHQEV